MATSLSASQQSNGEIDLTDVELGQIHGYADPPPDFAEATSQEARVFETPLVDAQDPPPEFTVYEAECRKTFAGNIVSHDKHLNEDGRRIYSLVPCPRLSRIIGEALYRFLLSQAAITPNYRLLCVGTHDQYNGNNRRRITDFRFSLDLTQYIIAGPLQWSIADSEPAYRGLMVPEVQLSDGKRNAFAKENTALSAWKQLRTEKGLPPWIGSTGRTQYSDSEGRLRSTRTLRQWADDYCASPKYLKEFIYKKVRIIR
jgi:hypothetical protein